MQVAPEISFRSFEPTDRIRSRIDKEVETLEAHFPRMISCKVMVEGKPAIWPMSPFTLPCPAARMSRSPA